MSEQRAPFLSVTVLSYNYAHYLPECLDSILGQTMGDFEVILINDRSTDNSREVIERYREDPRIRLIDHEVNRGYVASLIEGCRLSRGKYISVISADDYALDPRAFEIARGVLETDPDIALFFSAWHQVDDHGTVGYERHASNHDYVVDGLVQLRRQLLTSDILHSGTIIRKDAYEHVGGYDARWRYAVDNNMWLALCTEGRVAYVDTPLYAYRAHSGNMSNSDLAFWTTVEEMLAGVDAALDRVPDSALPDKATLRRKARQRALVAVPTHDIFAGRLRRGWHGYWQSIRHFPMLTLAQPRTITVVLRTILPAQLFSRLERFKIGGDSSPGLSSRLASRMRRGVG